MRLAVVAGDPGGGNALLPVLEDLQDAGFALRLFAYGQTLARWSAAGWRVVPAEIPDLAECDVLLTATSVNREMYEQRWWLAARAASIPSFALVDFWSNYVPRFTSTEGVNIFPDRIGLPDRSALVAASEAGLPAERLCVVGMPVLERLAQRLPLSDDRRAEIRRANKVAAGKQLWIFVSQPLREMAALTGREGLDELQILHDVQRGLVKLQMPVALRLRRHPREVGGTPSMAWRDTALLHADSLHDCLCAADKVLGISSMLLLEAAALGCSVLSYQPGMAAGTDGLPWLERGSIERVYGYPELLIQLQKHDTPVCIPMKANEVKVADNILYELERIRGV